VAAATPSRRFNPVGNERLTAVVGIVVLLLTVVELGTILLGVHRLMSLHVFVGFVLIPPVLLKLATTGWRFGRYYTRNETYLQRGPPQIGMRLLAPLLVASTVLLFASGVAMGFVHGSSLTVARRLHGPASAVWIVFVGVHVLVYLRRALVSGVEDVTPSLRAAAPGASVRAYVLTTAVVVGIAAGVATVPAQASLGQPAARPPPSRPQYGGFEVIHAAPERQAARLLTADARIGRCGPGWR
jgi:hypothetical protein